MKLIVNKQKLTMYDKYEFVADNSIEFVDLIFEFQGKEWEGYTKVCQIKQGANTYDVLLVDDKGKLPREIIVGDITISVFGYKAGVSNRATTGTVSLIVNKSGFASTSQNPVPPTPDLYTQLLAEINAANENVTAINEALESMSITVNVETGMLNIVW